MTTLKATPNGCRFSSAIFWTSARLDRETLFFVSIVGRRENHGTTHRREESDLSLRPEMIDALPHDLTQIHGRQAIRNL